MTTNTPANVVRHFRLWRRCFVQAISREAQFRTHFISTLIVGIAQTGLSLIPILLMYSYTEDVNGWSRGETIMLTGVFLTLMAILAMFIAPNVWRFSGYVQSGELDLILIRPVNTQFLITFRWINPHRIFNVLFGLIVLGIGLREMGSAITPVGSIQALILFLCSLVIITCLWTAGTWLAFWFTSVDTLPNVMADMMEAGRYPVSYYPGPLQILLLTVFPIGFAVTMPAEAMRGSGSWGVVLMGVAFAVGAIVATRLWWQFAVKRYASASS